MPMNEILVMRFRSNISSLPIRSKHFNEKQPITRRKFADEVEVTHVIHFCNQPERVEYGHTLVSQNIVQNIESYFIQHKK